MWWTIFVFACLTFETTYSKDKDGDGYNAYENDCNDNNSSIGPLECSDKDGDGYPEYNENGLIELIVM